MKILVITSLFPNTMEPEKGMYNKQQILELSKLCELKVVAPVPWSPNINIRQQWNLFSRVSQKGSIDGVEVFHPRYFITPKIGRSFYAFLFYISLYRNIKVIYKFFKFDLIYAPWVYPDGVGSYYIAKKINIPIVTGVLGSDVNVYANYFFRKKIIADALKNSQLVIAVSSALKDKVLSLGVSQDKVKVILNGINSNLFKPCDQEEIKNKLNLSKEKKYILFIGNLYAIKGVEFLIESFKNISFNNKNIELLIIGDGDLKEQLIRKVNYLEIRDKVSFLGRKPHNELPDWINCCDVFCLPSIHEGCPNVVLESLACGKPVVASNVGGIPELITSDEYGFLVASGNCKELTAAIQIALEKKWNPELLRKKVADFTWENNAKVLYQEFNKIFLSQEKH